MNDGNFRIRCIKSGTKSNRFTVGMEYDVINGYIHYNNGVSMFKYYTLKDITKTFGYRFELVEEKESGDMSNWNGKIRCLDSNGMTRLTEGKIYEVKNGTVTYNDGSITISYESFDDFCESRISEWEEVKEMEDLREMLKPCMLVRCRDGILRMVVQCENNVIVKSFYREGGIAHVRNYTCDLIIKSKDCECFDIIEVYGYDRLFSNSLQPSTESRELIWKREEKSPQQIEIEQIEAEQRKLADRLSKLRKEL